MMGLYIIESILKGNGRAVNGVFRRSRRMGVEKFKIKKKKKKKKKTFTGDSHSGDA